MMSVYFLIMTAIRTGLVVISTVLLSACSTLPAFGPSADVIESAATSAYADTDVIDAMPFALVNISASTLPQLQPRKALFPASLRNQDFLTKDEPIHVSDVLEIRVWEVAEDGLFATAGQRSTVLSVVVSNSGKIEVPYAGVIQASGLSASELRTQLLERYRGQAIEPEISVRVVETQARTASVLGDLRSPQRLEIPPRGIRLLDFLAQTGGTQHPGWETMLSLQRNTHSYSLRLQEITDTPINNIVLLPGDTVQVTHIPRFFAVYGAVSRSGNIALPDRHPSLSDLLAEAGGLNDMMAEPASVFVFRQTSADNSQSHSPVAYRLDFSQPDAFLLAGRFQLNADDIVYVATADASEFRKLVTTLLSPFIGSAASVQSVGN